MPTAADVYRRVGDGEPLSSGDIAFVSLARTRVRGEGPPGEAFDSVGRIPAYPRPQTFALPNGREIALDTMFGLVVTHSCEIDRQQNRDLDADHFDCRLTIAPIVPESAVTLIADDGSAQSVGWTAIEQNAPVASLYLPPVDDMSAFAPGVVRPWPRAFADLRGLATVSRQMVATDRLCGLTPAYVGVLQRQLARFFTWRDLARSELVEALVGRRIESALALNAAADRWRVTLTADNGESLTVELRTA